MRRRVDNLFNVGYKCRGEDIDRVGWEIILWKILVNESEWSLGRGLFISVFVY